MNLATIPDLSSLLVDATVEEIDRGRCVPAMTSSSGSMRFRTSPSRQR
jgi:hypothetical protein